MNPLATLDIFVPPGGNGLRVSGSEAPADTLFHAENYDGSVQAMHVTGEGKVGIGTAQPLTPLHVYDSAGDNQVSIDGPYNGSIALFFREEGVGKWEQYYHGGQDELNFYSYAIRDVVMSLQDDGKIGTGTMNPSHPLEMASGAHVTSGGVWINASSREYKENIRGLTADKAIETLKGLNPVEFNYAVDKGEKHVGFIAEDVPELISNKKQEGLKSDGCCGSIDQSRTGTTEKNNRADKEDIMPGQAT